MDNSQFGYKMTLSERVEEFVMDHPFLIVLLVTLAIPIVVLLVVFALTAVQINTGDKQYTGYIYSAEDSWAKTSGHLRFSESAGKDEQPSFCVDKKDGQLIKDLAGSGKKVKVTVPAGFAITWPWICGIPATIEVMEGE